MQFITGKVVIHGEFNRNWLKDIVGIMFFDIDKSKEEKILLVENMFREHSCKTVVNALIFNNINYQVNKVNGNIVQFIPKNRIRFDGDIRLAFNNMKSDNVIFQFDNEGINNIDNITEIYKQSLIFPFNIVDISKLELTELILKINNIAIKKSSSEFICIFLLKLLVDFNNCKYEEYYNVIKIIEFLEINFNWFLISKHGFNKIHFSQLSDEECYDVLIYLYENYRESKDIKLIHQLLHTKKQFNKIVLSKFYYYMYDNGHYDDADLLYNKVIIWKSINVEFLKIIASKGNVGLLNKIIINGNGNKIFVYLNSKSDICDRNIINNPKWKTAFKSYHDIDINFGWLIPENRIKSMGYIVTNKKFSDFVETYINQLRIEICLDLLKFYYYLSNSQTIKLLISRIIELDVNYFRDLLYKPSKQKSARK